VKIGLLNDGYLELVESWGSDERIIEAARMSTGKGFLGWGPNPQCEVCGQLASDDRNSTCASPLGHNDKPGPQGDEKLLRFLWEHNHATPFEMAGLTIEVKAPIVVFREWHRHRTQSYNELSARYTPLPDENYHPTVARMMIDSDGKNRQAGAVAGAAVLDEASALEWGAELADVYAHIQRVYESGLRRGVPKELARLPVPVARYSRMRASANLRNWLGFLSLRMNPAAQWEIREYANALHGVLQSLFPRTMDLFDGSR
jgi:thymidylate synthase (FAD)